MTDQTSPSGRRPQRLWVIGGIGLVIAAVIVGVALFLGGSDDGDQVSSVRVKNAAPSASDQTGLQKLLSLSTSGGSAKATLTNVNLAPGFSISSVTAERASNGTVTGAATVMVGENGLQLGMNMSFTDVNNWKLIASTTNGEQFSPMSGITIDPNTITGAITKSAGTVTWSLTGSTITWKVSTGAKLQTKFSISNTCPFSDPQKCPSSTSTAYIAMPAATLAVYGMSNTLALAGGIDVSGNWARLEGSVGTISFEGNGISNTQLVVWRGPRTDSFDTSMVMPDLSSLNDGANFEFCGTFTVSIPKVTNKSTNGCARWSSQGVVLAQSGAGTTLASTMPATDTNGASVSTSVSTNVKGFAWTNIPDAASFEISFGGVEAALTENKWTLAGVATLPGAAKSALGIDAQSLNFNVRGTFSATEISISGDVPVKLTIGAEPFKINVQSLRATIAAGTSSGFTFSLGTTSNVTLGYSPNTRQITSSLSLVAATKPSVGMVLSLSALGKKNSADSNVSGTTIASRLSRPDLATYIWPDQFGITGLNLFSLTAEIGYTAGSPVVSYTSTSYLDAEAGDTSTMLQCNGSCDPSDWMVSSLSISASYTNPCFAYGFDGTAGGSSLAVDGGVMKTSVFKIGIAPAGCSIESNGQTQSLPVGFFGFQFSAQFGSSTFDVATQLTSEGFVFDAEATNFELAGISYPSISLSVKFDSSGSQVSFAGQMTSPLGASDISASFASSSSGITQDLTASVTDWSMGREGTFNVPTFEFSTSFTIPFDGGCADIAASASGEMIVKKKTYRLEEASFRFTCEGLESLVLAINMEHEIKGGASIFTELRVDYSSRNGIEKLSGSAAFEYKREFSETFDGRDFDKDVTVRIEVEFELVVGKESSAGFSFGGSFDADRVSGDIGCDWESSDMDFRCSGELRLNPSWAGVYRRTWDIL